ncbi:MAG: TetR/AcrR family transcriptional regulator [Marmoricola sp.]|nr:TetR/AcrR family transcriptional regulator [Marmoricola sp.]
MTTDTRQLILDTAIRMFEERGYAGTTMRAIATEAGVSPSNAYYWFASKDQLVQEFYRRIQVAHRERSEDVLARGGTLSERLLAVERAGIEVMAPYHGFGAAFVGTAILPGAAVSPFSEESAGARELSMEIYRDVVAGASPAVPAKLAPVLPDLLWLAHLSVTLYWVIDTSPGQERTRLLIDRSVAMLVGAIKLARLPGAAGLIGQVGSVLDVVVPERRSS